MGKKVMLLMLVLITNCLWAKNPFSNIKDVEKVIELSRDVDLLVEGEIIDKEYIYIHRKTKQLVDINNISLDNLGKIVTFTKFTVRIVESFKNRGNVRDVNVWVLGGVLNIDGENKINLTSHTAYPLLDSGDTMIMGLKKNRNIHPISNIKDDYVDGYHFYKAEKLQIPSSDEMIESVENGELEKAKKNVYNKKLRSLEEEGSTEFPSYEDIDNNILKASIQKNKNIEAKKKFIKSLKISLRREYE